MVNWYIYAKDFSGSTWRQAYYHDAGLKSFHLFESQVENLKGNDKNRICYLHWDTICREVNHAELVKSYEEQLGNGGTQLHVLIGWIKSNMKQDDIIKQLYIITDGLIETRDMEECAQETKDLRYESIVFYAFNRNEQEINMSIVVPFLNSKCKIYCNEDLVDDSDLSEDYNYAAINVENFYEEIDKLKSYIKLKFLLNASSKRSFQEVEKLNSLRNRLLKELDARNNDELNTIINEETRDRMVLLKSLKQCQFYKNLFNNRVNLKQSIDGCIATLRNYIESTKKSLQFHALRFEEKFTKSGNTLPESVEDVDCNFEQYAPIEFPDVILLTEENKSIPVIILLTSNLLESVRSGEISFSKIRGMLDCPLFFEKMLELKDSIGYFYSLPVFRQLLKRSGNNKLLEPRSRREYYGGIIPLKEFDNYNDYVLAATYFDSKRVRYNIGLFYYLLYVHCKKKEWMDLNILKMLKEYVLRRISETVCRLGLSSLPLDPSEKVTLPTALWYCTELSSHLFMNDPDQFHNERLRMYHRVAHYMVSILESLNYPIDKNFVSQRANLLQIVHQLSHCPNEATKRHFIISQIFKRDKNGFLISEIKNIDNLKYLNLLAASEVPGQPHLHKQLISSNMFEHDSLKTKLKDYVIFLYSEKDIQLVPVLCEKTLRPHFIVDDRHSYYYTYLRSINEFIFNDETQQLEQVQPTLLDFAKILSLFNLYINFVGTYSKYPSLDEYIEFIEKKRRMTNGCVTIFADNTHKCIENIILLYDNMIRNNNISVDTFKNRTQKSVTRIDRIKMELSDQENCFLHTEDQIKKFIIEEEVLLYKSSC